MESNMLMTRDEILKLIYDMSTFFHRKDDERYKTLKQGLEQLTSSQLDLIVNYEGEICTDTYALDNNGNRCAIGLAVDAQGSTDEEVRANIKNMGFSFNKMSGVEGHWYTTDRRRDLVLTCKDILKERNEFT